MTITQIQFIHTEAAAISHITNALGYTYFNHCKSNCLAYSEFQNAVAVVNLWNRLHPRKLLYLFDLVEKAVHNYNLTQKQKTTRNQFINDLTEARKQLN